MNNKCILSVYYSLSLSLYIYIYIYIQGGPWGIMANVMDCGLKISEFELQLCYYIHFQSNTLGKGMNPLIPQLCVK